jgi:hypothetical protein
MKPLVFASYAQFGVNAEVKENLGWHNGICLTTQVFVETYFCV